MNREKGVNIEEIGYRGRAGREGGVLLRLEKVWKDYLPVNGSKGNS